MEFLSGPGGVAGAFVRGIDPHVEQRVSNLQRSIREGQIDSLNRNAAGRPPGIIIGKELAKPLGAFLGDTITYLDGSVTNNGSRPVRSLEVELNFVDTLNQVVLRETAHPLADRATPLQPGEAHAFRVTFDHMPVDWNQAPPRAKAVYVEF